MDGQLIAHFFRGGDRFARRIEHADGYVLESVEGDQAIVIDVVSSEWPCSPPTQQLSLEEINGSQLCWAWGLPERATGAGHWSVSVEQTDHGFRFDVACQYKSTAKSLGSGY